MENHKGHNVEKGTFHGIKTNAKILKITGWLTGVYFVIELFLGFYSGSVAVISDAFHTFSAVGGILIAFIANRISSIEANENATYGFSRSEIIGALLNGVFLLFMAIYVIYMGFNRLGIEYELPTGIMLIAAVGGLITEIISFKLVYNQQKTNINMKGAFWHILQTFIGSILIIIAAVVIKFTGYTPIDPILGMSFGVVLLWASYSIIKDTLNIFMQTVPKNIEIGKIKSDILQIDGVIGVRHIHAWVLTSNKNIFTAHIQIKNHKNSEIILKEVDKILKDKYKFYFSTVQLEEKHIKSEADDIDVKILRKHGKSHS
ncbi:MAG: cation diffusion facilitator family transporter [Candidatus Gracilibacteria bacterium]|nr:cation diffusion facilitator family transporter [Candidatus Gracilibacteria bacterium]